MAVYLTDSDVGERLTAVEGRAWYASVGHRQVAAYQRAFQAFLTELAGEPWNASDSPWLNDGGRTLEPAFYGDGGYSRYRVAGDGELILWGTSTRPEKAREAQAQGFTVYGGTRNPGYRVSKQKASKAEGQALSRVFAGASWEFRQHRRIPYAEAFDLAEQLIDQALAAGFDVSLAQSYLPSTPSRHASLDLLGPALIDFMSGGAPLYVVASDDHFREHRCFLSGSTLGLDPEVLTPAQVSVLLDGEGSPEYAAVSAEVAPFVQPIASFPLGETFLLQGGGMSTAPQWALMAALDNLFPFEPPSGGNWQANPGMPPEMIDALVSGMGRELNEAGLSPDLAPALFDSALDAGLDLNELWVNLQVMARRDPTLIVYLAGQRLAAYLLGEPAAVLVSFESWIVPSASVYWILPGGALAVDEADFLRAELELARPLETFSELDFAFVPPGTLANLLDQPDWTKIGVIGALFRFPRPEDNPWETNPTTAELVAQGLGALERTPSGRSAGPEGDRREYPWIKPRAWVPPSAVQSNAEEGLALRAYNESARGLKRPGGTEIGVARAVQLSSGAPITPRAAKRMVAYFSRHQVDQQAQGWGDLERPSPGFVAWLLWGGDEGWAWARQLVAQMQQRGQR